MYSVVDQEREGRKKNEKAGVDAPADDQSAPCRYSRVQTLSAERKRIVIGKRKKKWKNGKTKHPSCCIPVKKKNNNKPISRCSHRRCRSLGTKIIRRSISRDRYPRPSFSACRKSRQTLIPPRIRPETVCFATIDIRNNTKVREKGVTILFAFRRDRCRLGRCHRRLELVQKPKSAVSAGFFHAAETFD